MAKYLKKIEFTKSPTGQFGLGYSEGEQAEFSVEKAAELVEEGFAFYVDAQAEEEAKAAAAKTEKASK